MAVEKVADPYSVIGSNFPADSEEKFAATAASLAGLVAHHNVRAEAYRTAISGLSDDVLQGLLGDATRDEFGKTASLHEKEEQFCQKLSESFGTLGMQILACKTQINAECVTATAKIGQLETQKAASLKPAEQQSIQKKIDEAKKTARDEIKSLHDQLEHSLSSGSAAMQKMHDELEFAAGRVNGKAPTPDARPSHETPVEAVSRTSHEDPSADKSPSGSDTANSASAANAPGVEQASATNSNAPISPAGLTGGMPQPMPQMPQAPAGGMPGGGGMGSQLPGQELASKAMDMAQNASGKDSNYISDASVKDLLAASGEHGGSGHSSGAGGEGGKGGESSSGGGASAGVGGAGPVAVNPSAASGPSPATPVSSARPTSGPSVAMTELAGAQSSGPVSGLTSASGVSGLAGSPATQVAAAAINPAVSSASAAGASNAGFGAPVGFTPTAGSVGVPSTMGGFGSGPAAPSAPVAAAPGPPPVAAAPAVPASAVAPPPAPVVQVPPPVAPPPTVGGFTAMPASLGSAPSAILDLFGPAATVPVLAAAPERLESLPVEQRITILNTASIVTQMRESGWVASAATALLNDGANVAVVIATADDLSILPPDIKVPRASIMLHGFNLGEQFRSEWAGNADTVSKIVAAVDRHPLLDRSMIKHASAFTRNGEMSDPGVPFTPISMDAAWAIRYLYTAPRETVPAYTLRGETFDERQIMYLLGVAERRWQLPTIRLSRQGQARLESASMFASRWSPTGEAPLTAAPRGYDHRIAGYLWAATREAMLAGDLERASWYAQYLRYQTLPTVRSSAA